MIRDLLIPALKKHFPDKPFSFPTDQNLIAVLSSGFEEVGDLEIYDDGDEATICISEISHGHFNPYDEKLSQNQIDTKVTDDVIEFLRALFSDQVLFYCISNRGMGGWTRLDLTNEKPDLSGGGKYFLWSGPYNK